MNSLILDVKDDFPSLLDVCKCYLGVGMFKPVIIITITFGTLLFLIQSNIINFGMYVTFFFVFFLLLAMFVRVARGYIFWKKYKKMIFSSEKILLKLNNSQVINILASEIKNCVIVENKILTIFYEDGGMFGDQSFSLPLDPSKKFIKKFKKVYPRVEIVSQSFF